MSDDQYQELLAKCMRKAEREREEEERMSKTKKNMLVFDTTNLTSRDSDGRPALRVEEIEREAKEEGQPESHMSVALRTGPQLDAASARIAELEARNVELEQRLCIMVERAENREARLKEAEKQLAEANELYSRCLNGNQVLRQRAQEAEEQGIKEAEAAYGRMEKAEADAGRFKLALEQVGKWTKFYMPLADGSSWEETLREVASYTEAVLSPAEQSDDEKGVKG